MEGKGGGDRELLEEGPPMAQLPGVGRLAVVITRTLAHRPWPLLVHSPPARKQGRGRQERTSPPGGLHFPESNAATSLAPGAPMESWRPGIRSPRPAAAPVGRGTGIGQREL